MNNVTSHKRSLVLASVATVLLAAACGSGGGGNNASHGSSGNAGSGGAAALVSVAAMHGSHILENGKGDTLYSASVEKGGHISCVASCTAIWKPVVATAAGARSAGSTLGQTFGTVTRPDGTTQLTYHGMPLYTFTEEGPGQTTGNGATDHFGTTTFHWSSATTSGSMAPPQGSGTSSGESSGGGGYGY